MEQMFDRFEHEGESIAKLGALLIKFISTD